ncbi:hypothetical protein [Desulfopila sp. IMCC35008]|uniref:hypothetical protein n=1 Tax=Desulfopila sp. IMCC35008 TaxID=2653858 RepID=UPI0013D478AC|nr:hypothetical protein [Desulfopila sp. IMCC35008]
MRPLLFHFYQLVLFVLFLCNLSSWSFAGEQLTIIDSSQSGTETGEDDNWNSHIDNQAYLREYEQRRRRIEQDNQPIIIINRETAYPYPRGKCDSETVYVQSGGSMLIYSDRYRTNCYPRHVIVPVRRPVRPAPYIGRQEGKRFWSTGK